MRLLTVWMCSLRTRSPAVWSAPSMADAHRGGAGVINCAAVVTSKASRSRLALQTACKMSGRHRCNMALTVAPVSGSCGHLGPELFDATIPRFTPCTPRLAWPCDRGFVLLYGCSSTNVFVGSNTRQFDRARRHSPQEAVTSSDKEPSACGHPSARSPRSSRSPSLNDPSKFRPLILCQTA